MLSQSHPPSEIRDDLEQNLLYCDALLFIYGCTSVRWVRSQLLSCRRFLSKREEPLQVIALYQGPPEEKAPVDIMLGDMHTIDCRFGLDEAKLQEFIESLG
jgi:hypothetical protein